MKNGCHGKILRINLAKTQVTEEIIPEDIYCLYLGGSGLAARIIADEVDENADPEGPENILVFATGPMNALNVPGAGRWTVAAISPLTGYWGESNGGGFFGSQLKRTGYDAFVLEGRAPRPVYIVIDNGAVSIENAAQYWGMDAIDASHSLVESIGRNFSTVCIGQAGERVVPVACIISDNGHGHAGRTGMGAVMGSKNVKAIAVGGSTLPDVFDPEKANACVKMIRKNMLASDFLPDFRKNGQPGSVIPRYAEGLLPIKNWLTGEWEGHSEKIAPPVYNHILKVKPKACAFCPMACKRWVTVDDGPYQHAGPGPEYETLAMIGSQLCIDDLKAISYANDLCNRYGIDTMSTGGIVAMVFELYDNGVLTSADLDGIEAQWGSADAMIALVRKIGLGEGIGAELGKGVAYYNKMHGETDAALAVRGLEVPAHDPRAYYSMAVTYVTSPRGACHLHGFSEAMELGVLLPELGVDEAVDRFEERKKGHAAVVFQDLAALYNALVWCCVIPFADVSYQLLVDTMNAITGWQLDAAGLLKTGERITNLKQIINIKRGLTRSQMKLPKRFLTPLDNGGSRGKVPNVELMLEDYLAVRQWDKNAMPREEKLRDLGLSDTISW